MKAKAEESIGEVMLYTLIEMAKDSLTEGNIPHSPCIVCLEHFDENSSFRRTACYHYFHNHCLHKYLANVRAQHAEEEAEDATRMMHHREVKNKEIICPMCRSPLDEETLSVHCLDVDEDDDETFVPSPALRVQQHEMAIRFERQKAQGGIIDLEWEKNKYLVNPEDRSYVKIAPETSENKTEEEMDEGKQKSSHSGESNMKETGNYKDSQQPIQFHGNRADDRRFGRPDRLRDYDGGHGRVWRGFRDRHRNLHNDRRYEDADEHGTPSDRYRYKGERSYNAKNYNDDHSRKKRDERGGKYIDEWERSDSRNNRDKGWSRDGLPYDDRQNLRGGRWRDKGRGGGKGSDAFEKRSTDHRTQCTEIDSSPFQDDSDRLSLEQSNIRKPDSSSQYHKEVRRDRRSYRGASDGQDQRTKGHERRYARGSRGAFHCSGEYFSKGDKWSVEEEEDRCSEDVRSRCDGMKSHHDRGFYQNRHHRSQDSHQECYGSHGERNQRRRERETAGARLPESKRNNVRRSDANIKNVRDENANGKPADQETADQETDADKDLRNFEINEKWRRINSTYTTNCDLNQTMPKKFGIIDDDEVEELYNDASRGDHASESDDDSTSKPNPNYSVMNEEMGHFYPGFNQDYETESWEDEIDPYATEYTKFRNEELKKYVNHQKSHHIHLQNKLKQRVQQENAMDEEMRRIGKEQVKRHNINECQKPEDGNTPQSTGIDESILKQCKRNQEKWNPGLEQEIHSEKCQQHGKTEKFSTVGKQTASASSDASHSSEGEHSIEEFSAERNHVSSAQCGHSEKDVVNGGIVNDIKWCGRKPPENSYPPTSILDCDAEKDLIHNDVYEDAWKRRSALAKKPNESRKKKNKKNFPEQNRNKIFRERTHESNSVQEERSLKVEDNDRKSSNEETSLTVVQYEERLSFSEASVDEASLASISNHVPKFQHEFKKPKPLDMRKANNHLMVSRGLNDIYVDEDKRKTTSQIIDTSSSKTAFKKPKPVDFRKTVHKPLHKYAKDAPS